MNGLLDGPAEQPGWAPIVFLVAAVAAIRGVWSPCGLSMVSAINPFTERSRGHRFWLTACWFVAGSLLGGAALGALAAAWAALASPLPATVASGAAIACCLVAIAADDVRIPFRLPLHPRQVNERWLGSYRRWIYAAGFGAQIGCGFATYIMTAAVYLTVALGALTGSAEVGLLAGLLFGLVRGLAVFLSGVAPTAAALRELHRRLDLLAPWSVRAVLLTEALAAVVIGYLTVGWWGAVVVALAVSVLWAAAGSVGRRGPVPTAACAVPEPPGPRGEPAAEVGAAHY